MAASEDPDFQAVGLSVLRSAAGDRHADATLTIRLSQDALLPT